MAQTLESLSPKERDEIVEDLNDLVQLDHDAIAAYTVTIEKLENEEWAAIVGQFKGDHERHVRELSAIVRRLGGRPAEKPHVTSPFKKGMVRLAVGGDKMVLRAFRVNELQVRSKYDAYAHREDYPAEVIDLLRQNAQDEHRHYDWVVGILGEKQA